MNKRITLFLITLLTVCGVQSQNNNQNRNADFHKWAETPPMGWNSWDCFGANVTEAEVKANADYMAEHLKDYVYCCGYPLVCGKPDYRLL